LDKEFEKKYHSLEKSYWWFVSRRDIIRKLIKKYDKSVKILEIGSSSGKLISSLNMAGYRKIIGIDISREAINSCIDNDISRIIQMEGSELGFKEGEFDLIIASDILEHINNDFHAISEWKRVLKTSGNIIAFVPAFSFLWSHHDIENKHFRRYNRGELLSLFRKNGLQVVRISYWNFTLFFPIFFNRVLKKAIRKDSQSRSDLYRMKGIVNSFLSVILMVENTFCKFFNLPLGLSLFMIAKKIE